MTSELQRGSNFDPLRSLRKLPEGVRSSLEGGEGFQLKKTPVDTSLPAVYLDHRVSFLTHGSLSDAKHIEVNNCSLFVMHRHV